MFLICKIIRISFKQFSKKNPPYPSPTRLTNHRGRTPVLPPLPKTTLQFGKTCSVSRRIPWHPWAVGRIPREDSLQSVRGRAIRRIFPRSLGSQCALARHTADCPQMPRDAMRHTTCLTESQVSFETRRGFGGRAPVIEEAGGARIERGEKGNLGA